jgi:hypothetical protein
MLLFVCFCKKTDKLYHLPNHESDSPSILGQSWWDTAPSSCWLCHRPPLHTHSTSLWTGTGPVEHSLLTSDSTQVGGDISNCHRCLHVISIHYGSNTLQITSDSNLYFSNMVWNILFCHYQLAVNWLLNKVDKFYPV